MTTTTCIEAKEDFSDLIERVKRENAPIAITQNGEQAVVMIPAKEYASIQETLYLLSTPANAERIRKGLADYQAGNGQTHQLCD